MIITRPLLHLFDVILAYSCHSEYEVSWWGPNGEDYNFTISASHFQMKTLAFYSGEYPYNEPNDHVVPEPPIKEAKLILSTPRDFLLKLREECPPMVIMSLLVMIQVRVSLIPVDNLALLYYNWCGEIIQSLSHTQKIILSISWPYELARWSVHRSLELNGVKSVGDISEVSSKYYITIMVIKTSVTEDELLAEQDKSRCEWGDDKLVQWCTVLVHGVGYCSIFNGYVKGSETMMYGTGEAHGKQHVSESKYRNDKYEKGLVFTHSGYLEHYGIFLNRTVSALIRMHGGEQNAITYLPLDDHGITGSSRRKSCIEDILRLSDCRHMHGNMHKQKMESDFISGEKASSSFYVSRREFEEKQFDFLKMVNHLLGNQIDLSLNRNLFGDRLLLGASETIRNTVCRCSDLQVVPHLLFGRPISSMKKSDRDGFIENTDVNRDKNINGESDIPIGVRVKYLDSYSRESWLGAEFGPVKPSWPDPPPWEDDLLKWGGGRIPG